MSEFLSRRDLDFLLFEWLGLEARLDRPAYAAHTRGGIAAAIDTAQRIATALFAPHYKESDRAPPFLRDGDVRVLPAVRRALSAYDEAGFTMASLSEAERGLGLPHAGFNACQALFFAANVATTSYKMLSIANARLIVRFGTSAQAEAFAAPQLAGTALGTMCLSEPDAGSSLADIATRAEAAGEDRLGRRYRIKGGKMWISGGDHDAAPNIVHLVLARDADGVGLSLFAVPKWLPGEETTAARGDTELRIVSRLRNDVTVAGLNHKMGFRGIPNCVLNFGADSEGATGWLIGEPGQGLATMFRMMNEARIQIGLAAAALGYRGYRQSLAYARERRQGRPPGRRDGPPVPIAEHADVKRMLLAQKAYAEGALALVLYCSALLDDSESLAEPAEREEAAALLGLLTPVAKSWPSEYCLAANDLAIQVHGGYGYTNDFDVEQIYRDNRLNPIHEGTAGIQAIDLVGRKIASDSSGALALLGDRVNATAARAMALPALAAHGARLTEAWRIVDETVRTLRAAPDRAAMLRNATPFASAFGHIVVAWLWLDQALTASTLAPQDGFARGKRRACDYFFGVELPRALADLASLSGNPDLWGNLSDDEF